MKKKIILLAIIVISTLTYSADNGPTNSVKNISVTGEIVGAADVTAPSGTTMETLAITYRKSDISSYPDAAAKTFKPLPLVLTGTIGRVAGVSVQKDVDLVGPNSAIVKAQTSFTSTGGDLLDVDASNTTDTKLEGAMVTGTANVELGLVLSNFVVDKPETGDYTATVPVLAYYN